MINISNNNLINIMASFGYKFIVQGVDNSPKLL